MAKRISIFPVLLLVALAALIAGCGGSDDDTVTKAEFIKKADAICKKTDQTQLGEFQAYTQRRLARLNRMSFKEREEELTSAVYVPSIQKEIKELEALDVPPGDEQKVEAVFTQMKASLKEFAKDPTGYLEGGPSDPFNKAFRAARDYGLNFCKEIA